jgi:hypothetical protein
MRFTTGAGGVAATQLPGRATTSMGAKQPELTGMSLPSAAITA